MVFYLKSFISLLILALTVSSAASARILDEAVAAAPATVPLPGVSPGTTNPAGGAAPIIPDDSHLLTFFMHDILGGSHPSAIAVTGIVANPAVGGQVPFAKPNGAVLPVNNGIPTNNANGGIVTNNIPFLTGLSGFSSNILQNNNGNNIIEAHVRDDDRFDDELTEGHELGSGLVGKAQGFYISSSEDGTSQTMAFTVMFTSGSYADSLSFFGVHRTAVAESHLAVMGGTGKYVNAKGFATVKTFPAANQHETDGVETLLQITVYLAY
ncbi:UNVERIFIED_CONTAM: Dirigent protein 25 [Sesamum calycinum]|uniref:Dirigent protein n=1 Tax=Sesamum calycinum TaxID=2727403 RepID=A0AAW2SCG9_9LAMI